MSAGRWESVRTNAGWHLRLVGANGEIVMTSETYADQRSVENALDILFATIANQEKMEISNTVLTEVDMRTAVEQVQVRSQRFLAKCRDCSDAEIPFPTREERSSYVSRHRLTTAHRVRQWEEMR